MHMTDEQILAELRSGSLLNRVRKLMHQSAGRIEQRRMATPVEVRRMEFEDAAEVIALVEAHTGAPGNSRAIRDEDDHSSR